MILLILICVGPGDLWLQALDESHWASEYSLQLSGAQASVSSTGLLPDPLLQFSVAGSPVETRNGPVLGSIGFQQKIPWPAFLSSSRAKAEVDFSSAEERKRLLDLRMRTAISQAWSEVYSRQQRELLYSERAEYLASLLVSATGSSSTLMMEHSALADLRIRVAILNQKPLLEHNLITPALGELNALTGLSTVVSDELPPPEWFLDRISNVTVDPPSLRIALASVESAAAEVRRVKSLAMPDFMVGASYSPIGSPEIAGGVVSPGQDSWMISAGISLPLGYSGDRARIDAAEFALGSALEHQFQLEGEIYAEIASQTVVIQNAVDELDLLAEVLPLSESAVISASQSWISGRGSYSTLISALQNNIEIQMTVIEKEALLVNSAAKWLELAGAVTKKGEFL